jgi:hypothetical protein
MNGSMERKATVCLRVASARGALPALTRAEAAARLGISRSTRIVRVLATLKELCGLRHQY